MKYPYHEGGIDPVSGSELEEEYKQQQEHEHKCS